MKKILLSTLILLGGCNQPNPKLLVTEPLTPPDATIRTSTGQRFEVVLPSLGATASYKWVLDTGANSALVRLSGEREATKEFPSNPPPGYAPNRIFSFEALAAGKTTLSFSLQPIGNAPALSIKRVFPVEIE